MIDNTSNNSDLEHDSSFETSSVKRDSDRDSLFLTANLRFQTGGDEGAVRIRNLSAGGLMAEAAVQAPRGSRVEVELKNIGWIGGKVAWVAERKLGIAFDHPIDPKTVRLPIATKEKELPHYLKKLNRMGEKIRF